MTPNKRQAFLLKRLSQMGDQIETLRGKVEHLEHERDRKIEEGREMGLPVAMLTEYAGMARETYYTRKRKAAR
jgi:hypothetical protein